VLQMASQVLLAAAAQGDDGVGTVPDVVDRAVMMPAMPSVVRSLLHAAARSLPASGRRGYAAELARLADAYPQSWPQSWPATLRAPACAAVGRRVFLKEIGCA
jgi:hypothetical protein